MIAIRFLFMLMFIITGLIPATHQETLAITYTIPRNGAQNASAHTTLAIRQGMFLDPSSVSQDLFDVTGSISQHHAGTVRLSDDRRTVLFVPEAPFTPGESVQVIVADSLRTVDGHGIRATRFMFTIATAVPVLPSNDGVGRSAMPGNAPGTAGFVTVPDSADIPPITVTTPATSTGNGPIFITPIRYDVPITPYLLLLDNAGEPIYIKSFPTDINTFVGNLRPYTVAGKPLLAYFLGTNNAPGWVSGKHYVLDGTYRLADTWDAGNGYHADAHDLLLLDNGHAIVMAYNPIVVDMTAYGGKPDATVLDCVIQELDQSKNVIFEWHSKDVIPYSNSYIDLTTSFVDYFHGNAITIDGDNNLIVSARNTSELIKINRETGAIMWQLGGRQNQFTFTNDAGFSAQHDIHYNTTGTFTLFDNGVWNHPTYSRAVEYAVNESDKTVTRVWEYRHSPDLYGSTVGSVQRLPNGNTLIGWGSTPFVTEVHPDGTKAFEISYGPWVNYRAFRFPWSATPAAPPVLVEQTQATTTTLTMSWNGATDVAAYQIYGGSTPYQQQLLATQARQGFETTVTVNKMQNASGQCFFRIRPVDHQGSPMAWSNIVSMETPACENALAHQLFLPLTEGK